MFGAYVEQEPYVRELIEAYMASKFKVVLEVLGRYSVSRGLVRFGFSVIWLVAPTGPTMLDDRRRSMKR